MFLRYLQSGIFTGASSNLAQLFPICFYPSPMGFYLRKVGKSLIWWGFGAQSFVCHTRPCMRYFIGSILCKNIAASELPVFQKNICSAQIRCSKGFGEIKVSKNCSFFTRAIFVISNTWAGALCISVLQMLPAARFRVLVLIAPTGTNTMPYVAENAVLTVTDIHKFLR